MGASYLYHYKSLYVNFAQESNFLAGNVIGLGEGVNLVLAAIPSRGSLFQALFRMEGVFLGENYGQAIMGYLSQNPGRTWRPGNWDSQPERIGNLRSHQVCPPGDKAPSRATAGLLRRWAYAAARIWSGP